MFIVGLLLQKVHGVGVFAIRGIPKGADPFRGCDDSRYVKIREEELRGIDAEVLKAFKDAFVFADGVWYASSKGLQSRDISYYMNHSDNPNMVAENHGERFVADRLIEKGEELLVDYNTYDDLTEKFRPRKRRR